MPSHFCSLPRERVIAESKHTLTTRDAWLYRQFADGVRSPSRARARRSSRRDRRARLRQGCAGRLGGASRTT